MNRIYRSVFWLVLGYSVILGFKSAGEYGVTWRYDAYWLPEAIVDPNAPVDTLNDIGHSMEKPLWAFLYMFIPSCSAFFLYTCWKISRREHRLAAHAVWNRNFDRIEELPLAEQAALHRRNNALFEKHAGYPPGGLRKRRWWR